jgi:hypothetical protein
MLKSKHFPADYLCKKCDQILQQPSKFTVGLLIFTMYTHKFSKINFYEINIIIIIIYFLWHCSPARAMASSSTRILYNTQRRTIVGRTPLGELSARRRDLFLTTHNTHDKHPCPRWDSNPRSQQESGSRHTL